MAIIYGFVGGLLALALLYHAFFRIFDEFWDSLWFWFMPDIFAWLNGEEVTDWKSQARFVSWVLIGAFVGAGTYTAARLISGNQ